MEKIKNEKGVTLIEILLSMAILSIIFLSFLSIFPQMGMMNKMNEDKTQAINYAKEILLDWQNSTTVKNFLEEPTTEGGSLPPHNEDSNFYYFLTTKGNFDVNIKIKKNSDLTMGPSEARFIQVQLLNNKGTLQSETYGYIKLE